MPCAPMLRFGGQTSGDCKTEAGEIMSGVLEVIRGSNFTSSAYDRLPSQQYRLGVDGTCASQRVFVRVYRTSSEHFAVLYPIRAIVTACRPLASLNLRSCSVKSLGGSGREFRISPRSCEGVAVTFRALEGSSEIQISDWINAFTDAQEGNTSQRRKKISDHRSPLPVLEESEEDVLEEPTPCPTVSVQ